VVRVSPGRALLPGKGPPVPTVDEAGWASTGQDTEARGKILAAAGDRTPVAQSAVRRKTG
jgi:hypothetical protein